MHIMPHVDATGILVHTPVTHGHIITLVASLKRKPTKDEALEVFRAHPRIRVVRIADGFNTNTSFFNYARFLAQAARRHVRDRGVGGGRRLLGRRPDVRHQHPAGVDRDPRDHRRHPGGHPDADRPAEAVALTNRYLGMG